MNMKFLRLLVLLPLFMVLSGFGWFPGTTQHDHSSLGTGGILPNYSRILNRNFTATSIFNSSTETSLYSVLIPANTLQAGNTLHLSAIVRWDQVTGVAQNEPTIRMFINNNPTAGHTGNTTSFASNVTPRMVQLDIFMTWTTANAYNIRGTYSFIDQNSSLGLTPVLNKSLVLSGSSANTAADITLEIRVANTVANASYGTTLQNSQLDMN